MTRERCVTLDGGAHAVKASVCRWTARRKREAIVAHVARCRFCRALLSHGVSRRDRELLDAAGALLADHVAGDDARAAFAGQRRR
jgi:hypothetical protein